jgi:chemotaxis protein methyltransferase CheR
MYTMIFRAVPMCDLPPNGAYSRYLWLSWISLLSVIEPALQQQFLTLINQQTGLRVRAQDWPDLAQYLQRQAGLLHEGDLQAYYQHLQREARQAIAQPSSEWQALMVQITIGESYFFRDRGQIQVLAEHILPKLIERQRAAYFAGWTTQPRLRLWSAGCSTGEEPYSLAMLLETLIPDWPDWHLMILGTDINPQAIAQARKGLYRDWSFRQTDPQWRQNYFSPVGAHWQIHDRLRQRVTFACGNLLRDPFPNPKTPCHHLDLILCRNVFIYFDAAAIAQVLTKFHQALNLDGYLISGHPDLYEQKLTGFQVLSFPDSMVYQRVESPAPTHPLPSTDPVRTIPEVAPALNPAPAIPPMSSQESHQQVTLLPTAEPSGLETKIKVHYLQALAHLDQGDSEAAVQQCQAALQLDSIAVEPLYLWAQIAQEQGDRKQAKTILKKILYLQPDSIPAYVELGDLYLYEAQTDRALKMYHTAQDLLRMIPKDTFLEHQGRVSAGELSRQIHQRLCKIA